MVKVPENPQEPKKSIAPIRMYPVWRNGRKIWRKVWPGPLPPGPKRAEGRNPRARGTNPRAKGT